MYRKLMSMSVASLLIFCVAPAQAAPDIEVLPLAHDFGDVEVGTSSTTIVTVENIGDDPLTVDSIVLNGSSNPAFAVTSAPGLPVAVDPYTSVDVEITFSPLAAGVADAQLDIVSDSPGEEEVNVSLTGTGVDVTQPPLTVADILQFFDESVADGTLLGNGPGNSANGRRKALRNKIKASGDLIEAGLIVKACKQLQNAYERTDGLPRPPEFVTGPAAPVLAGMLLDLMAELGCE
jgi:hypothetical protein